MIQESLRIKNLFDDLYEGSPWLGVNLNDTLKNITAQQAAREISPQWNTIWEIVNHVISWRQNVIRRVQGEPVVAPDNNYFSMVTDTSEAAWQGTLDMLKSTTLQWTALLEKYNENDLERINSTNGNTYYTEIQGILQHDAYHLGQIVLLAKGS